MYLKNIEIQGFKSFAKKIVLDFPKGITGIVGPNGSGKSNIADAVRWVFGEQKIKQLRGSKMEDVIFAGTAQRRPQSYAFVSISLDNSDRTLKLDFDDVVISRRLFRSGESEYLINGSSVRLKDVQELFYDTGIGKEGYSIIGQGQIDKILQGRPEDRRELFDEAAGIVKYKKRKQVAQRKLENERLNMTRISDIVSELDKRIGPLKKQSEAAQRFVALREDLKKLELNLFLQDTRSLKERLVSTREKLSLAEAELNEKKENQEDLRAGFEETSETLKELETRLEEYKNALSNCAVEKETISGRVSVLNEQIKSAKDAEKNFSERENALRAQLDEAIREKNLRAAELSENEKKLKGLDEKCKKQDALVLDIQNSGEEKRERTESLKEKIISLINERGQIQAKKERLLAGLEELKRRREELKSRLESFENEKNAQDKKVKELFAELSKAKSSLSQCESENSKLKEALAALFKEQKDIDTKRGRARESLAATRAKLESVRNITERYEGYGNAVKEVMKLKDSLKGIKGVVADIIKTDRTYETAIETALGGNIQNIVTDTEQTAKNAIEYLKENRLGRATFLPIGSVEGRSRTVNSDALRESGVIGLASSLVIADEKYGGVVNYLLGRIIVVSNVDNALRIAAKYRYQLNIVTLEGEMLRPGGSISGGAYKSKSNLLGRRREIDELEKRQDELNTELKSLEEKAKSDAANINSTQDKLNKNEASLSEKRLYYNTLSLAYENEDAKTKEIGESLAQSGKISEGIEKEREESRRLSESLEGELKQNLSDQTEAEEEVKRLDSELSDLSEKESAETKTAQDFRLEKSALTEQRSYLTSLSIKAEENVKRLAAELKGLKGSDERSRTENERRLTEIKEKETRAAELSETAQELSGKIKELEEQRAGFSKSHGDFLRQREEISEAISELDKEVFRLGESKKKLEEQIENKSNYIWESYELTFRSALEFEDTALSDAKDMRQRVSSVKSDIKSLGTINVSAIDEYREVSERYEFLSGQFTDLKAAEADLVKMIKDLDRQMRKIFTSEFARIKEEFSLVFKEMFGGGYGSIELEEDADTLDAGITIVAQPPGKRLQNIMQLSGGEKALTAIAVLFAIQNLKPSPFCILDEIEAALDDSNIVRFARYLHNLSGDVQFIVITHRKGTMEAADRLFGITMQERGVSTLISVNLADYEEPEEN